MSTSKPIRRAAIIGTGVIGASWAALFLAKGLEVTATDIAPDAEAALKRFIDAAWPALERLGLAPGASRSKLTFSADLPTAIKGAGLVQENGPERIDFKKKLYGQLDELLPPDVIIASSSSGLTMSEIQKGCGSHPERCVIGHPFNPPHLIPLVEVVPGEKTSPEAVDDAVAFYAALGKVPRVVAKEMPGFVANRLQRAIFRECCYLVIQGVVKVDELDDIVTSSIGLRWAADGPFRSFHLGGGAGGFKSFFKQFGPGLNEAWKNMAPVNLDEAAQDKIIAQAEASFAAQPPEQLESERDAKQLAIIRALKAVKAGK